MTTDPHSLIGAYVLDALDSDERAEFERHLTVCADCASEVTGLRAAAARLGAAAETAPPARLRAAVLAEVAHTRQLTPLVGTDDGRVVALVRRARTQSRVLLAAAAAFVVLAGTLGGVAVVEQRRASDLQARVEATASVVGAADATLRTGTGDGGRMTVVSSAELGRAVVTPALAAPSGRSLQLWVIHDGTFRSVGLVDGSRPLLATGVARGSSLGVTAEPEGGSKQPTTTPLVTVAL